MSDPYSFIFSDDPRTGTLSYPQLEARRKIAIALATRNRPYPKTIGEGLTALGEGLGEGMYNARTARDETAYQRQSDADVQRLTGQGATPAAPRAAPGGASLESADPATQAYAYAPPDTGPVFDPSKLSPEDRQKLEQARAYSGPQMPLEEWKQRIARNESGSRKDAYTLVGERSRRGDYPYGKYQVMGENIPAWTRAYYGKELTPEEFLANPKAQETVADGQGGKYLAKYGPEGAGAAWFAGEKGMNDPNRKDTLGTHVAEYKRRFNIPLVSRDQVVASAARAPAAQAFASEDGPPVQVASLGGGMPTPDTAPDAREAIAQSIAGPQPQQAPAQPPVQVAQAPQQQQFNRPPSPSVPQGPPPMPDQTPMTQQEINIRRAMGASADPTFRGRLEPFAERMEAERKFKDAQNMKLWEKDVIAYEKRTDPLQQEQLRKLREPTVKEVEGRILEKDINTGKWNDVTPGGSLPNLTEAQGRMLGFYQRGKWALHNLGDGKELTDFAQWHASGMPVIGNAAVNSKFQRQLQAANELAAVQLRLETGAAAPPAELKNVIDRLVPKPFDQPEAHLQKEQLRNALVKSYADQMGSKGQAYIDKFNREFELDKKEYDKKQRALEVRNEPPVRITDPDQMRLLKPGQRFIAPDGSVRRKPED